MERESVAPVQPLTLQLPVAFLSELDAWIARQAQPMTREHAIFGLACAALNVIEDFETSWRRSP